MEPSEQFAENVPDEETINQKALAGAQWALIHALERDYHGRTLWGSSCKFEDDVWFDGDGLVDKGRIYWASSLRTSSRALRVLVKIVCFEMVVTYRLERNSIKFKFNTQKNTIVELIESKRLLAGSIGDYLLELNHITDNDLLAMLDTRLALASSEKAFIQECSEVSQFIVLTNHLAESVPLFEIRAQLPWEKAGLNIQSWAKRRAADLGEIFRTAEGFGPLVPDTATPLIKRSLHLITNHGDHFKELGRILRDYKYGQEYAGPSADALLEQYGQILDAVVASPSIDGLPSTKNKLSAVFIWIRQLLYLARGACVNVILFTSGLRNSDMRGLKVGDCIPSGRVDLLYYLRANITKTKNVVFIPVPKQAQQAFMLLEWIKFTDSDFLLDGALFASDTYKAQRLDGNVRIVGNTLNVLLRDFAAHFNIPFVDPLTGEFYSAHNYRTTVAGWLDAHSNLSVLLIRRLFGHSNDVMPTMYLQKNPAFIQARKEQKERAAIETARQMALATSQGRIAGVKGDQLLRGYQEHVSRLQADPQKSHSLTDAELYLSFAQLIEQRILGESVCGFMTPFGVRCMRNPADSSQPPCARRSHRDKTREISKEVLRHINDIDPENCIGTSCDQAIIGPWSDSIKDSLLWYAQLLRHQHGDDFSDEHFRVHAIQFIRQYGPSIKKVFHVEVLTDGSVSYEKSTEGSANAFGEAHPR